MHSSPVSVVGDVTPGRGEELWKQLGATSILPWTEMASLLKVGLKLMLGESGGGKSTVIKLTLGLEKPDAGEILIDGEEITGLSEEELQCVRDKMGMVFQEGALFDSLTVFENVAYRLHEHSEPEDKIERKVTEILQFVGLEEAADKLPAELSGGMRKRVAIARAVALSPKYLFYDEPTTGLDPIMSDVINDLIISLHKQLGTTSVTITHDMKSAYKISTHIAMLYEGGILQVDTPENIQKTTNPVLKQFITGSAEGPIKMKVRAGE